MITQLNDNKTKKEIKILNSALKLFVEKGFHGTSTSAISRDAGVSAGILFHYYSTKKELIVTLFLDIKTEFYSLIFTELDESSMENSLTSFWESSVEWAINNIHKFQFITLYHNSPFYLEVKNNKYIKSLDNKLTELFEKGISEGYFKDVHVELLKSNAFNLVVSYIDTVATVGGNDKALLTQGWTCFRDSLVK